MCVCISARASNRSSSLHQLLVWRHLIFEWILTECRTLLFANSQSCLSQHVDVCVVVGVCVACVACLSFCMTNKSWQLLKRRDETPNCNWPPPFHLWRGSLVEQYRHLLTLAISYDSCVQIRRRRWPVEVTLSSVQSIKCRLDVQHRSSSITFIIQPNDNGGRVVEPPPGRFHRALSRSFLAFVSHRIVVVDVVVVEHRKIERGTWKVRRLLFVLQLGKACCVTWLVITC